MSLLPYRAIIREAQDWSVSLADRFRPGVDMDESFGRDGADACLVALAMDRAGGRRDRAFYKA